MGSHTTHISAMEPNLVSAMFDLDEAEEVCYRSLPADFGSTSFEPEYLDDQPVYRDICLAPFSLPPSLSLTHNEFNSLSLEPTKQPIKQLPVHTEHIALCSEADDTQPPPAPP